MFGGYGIYHQGIMFALVVDDTLYLKADTALAGQFIARGLPMFTYEKGGRTIGISYYMAPDEALEDPAELRRWAIQSFEVALRDRPVKRKADAKHQA